MARKDYSEAVDPKDTAPHPDEHWLVYEARLKALKYTRREIEAFGHAQYSQRPSPAGSVVDPDEDAPLLPADHPMAPDPPPVAGAPPVAAAIQAQDPPAGYDAPTPAEVIEEDEGYLPPMDLPPIDDVVDFPAEMPSLEPDVERAPLIFSPLQEIIGQIVQAAVGLPVPAPQSGLPVRRPIPARPTTTSDFIVPVTVAIVFFIIASQL